jgi:two-component system, OmpR family, alkaline phosphatase synthesis response regulator PhoP
MSEQKNVMIVDDDPHVVRSLAFVLNKEGYNIRTTSDGEEALEKIRDSKPNLMLLDIMMPKKNGYEVCQEVKNNPALSDIYIIMLSAKGQEADREQGLSMGANEFMTKPFSPMKVVERVKQILG